MVLRPVTAKGSLKIRVDLLPTPMRGLGPVQGPTVSLPMTGQETALDTLVPIKGREPLVATPSMPRNSRTLVPEGDKDLLMDSLPTALDNQALNKQTHPLEDTASQPMGSQGRAQEEDENHDMSTHQTAPDTQPLDTHHRLPDPEHPASREPVVLGPVTVKGSLRIQVDPLPPPMRGLGPVQGTNVGLPMDSQEAARGTLGHPKGKQRPTGSLILPVDSQGPAVHTDRDANVSRQQTALDTQQPGIDKPHLDPVTADTMDPGLVRPVTVKDNQKTQ